MLPFAVVSVRNLLVSLALNVLYGDKGPKVVRELTAWQYGYRVLKLLRGQKLATFAAIGGVITTQLIKVLHMLF